MLLNTKLQYFLRSDSLDRSVEFPNVEFYDGCSVHATTKIFGLATQTENDIISKGTFIINYVRKITRSRLTKNIHFTFQSIRQKLHLSVILKSSLTGSLSSPMPFRGNSLSYSNLNACTSLISPR